MIKIQTLIDWMSHTELAEYIATHSWVWPTAETLHFIGLCLLLGSLLVVDLRVMGLVRDIHFKAIGKFIIVSLVGFGINLTTGIVFLFGDPSRYAVNVAFQIKMLLVFAALANGLYFSLWLRKYHAAMTQDNALVLPLGIKVFAGLSLCLWVAVIIFGRMIPYVE